MDSCKKVAQTEKAMLVQLYNTNVKLLKGQATRTQLHPPSSSQWILSPYAPVALAICILVARVKRFLRVRALLSKTVESTSHTNSTPLFGQNLHACAQPASPE